MIYSIFLWILSLFSREVRYVWFGIDCQEGNSFCLISANFGLKNQSFTIQLDTSTTYTWIPSTKFDFDVPKYDLKNSEKGITTNKTVEIDDEDGIIYGKLSYDTFSKGNITMENFSFVLANKHDDDFKDYPYGKLGLGYAHDENDNFNFIQKLKENKLIDKKIFLIDRISKKLIIGYVPVFLQETPKISFPLYSGDALDKIFSQSWACEIDKIFCGVYEGSFISISFGQNGEVTIIEEKNIDYDVSKNAKAPAIFDIAYPYLLFPKKFYNYIKGNLIYKFLEGLCEEKKDFDSKYFICDKKNIFPDKNYLSFLIDSKMFFLKGSDIFKMREDGKYELLIRFPRKKNFNTFIFGAPFLNNWIISYDFDKEEVSLYGDNMADLSYSYLKFKVLNGIIQVIVTIIEIFIIFVSFFFIYYILKDSCCRSK